MQSMKPTQQIILSIQQVEKLPQAINRFKQWQQYLLVRSHIGPIMLKSFQHTIKDLFFNSSASIQKTTVH